MTDDKNADVIDLAEERERREAQEKLLRESDRAGRMLLGLGTFFQAVMQDWDWDKIKKDAEEKATGAEPARRTGMGSNDIGWVVRGLKENMRFRRVGWNGKGMWIELASEGFDGGDPRRLVLSHVLMRTAQGDFVPWLCSQTDLLAEDWEEVAEVSE